MATIFTAKSVRAPDLRAGEKFNGQEAGPKTSRENGVRISQSAAALLLPSAAIAGNDVLKSYQSPCGKADKFKPTYDAAHDALFELAEARNIAKLAAKATALLREHPVSLPKNQSQVERALYDFVASQSGTVTQQDVSRLWERLDREELRDYLLTAQTRINSKAITLLALAVNKTLAVQSFNHILDLKAELVGSVIAAVYDYGSIRRPARERALDIDLINRVMDLPISVPSWALDFDICKSDQPAQSEESLLLEKYQRIQEKTRRRRAELAACEEDRGVVTQKDVPHHCECTCEDCCVTPDPCCGELTYYIADLLELREETTCYKASDLAYIENVAPGETRIRKHDFRKTIELYSEEETSESRSEDRDHTVTERFSLQKEMQKQVSQRLDVDASITYDAKAYSATLNTSLGLSKDVSNREARETFREMVTNATTSIQTSSRSLSSRRVTTEMGEGNKHKFKNSTALPFVAKYFHVSQEKRGQVFSYGKRLMVDLFVPSPAALYRKLEQKKAEDGQPEKPRLPTVTTENGIERPVRVGDMDPKKWLDYISDYGLYDLSQPIPQPEAYVESLYYKREPDDKHWTESFNITVPDGYSATKINLSILKLHSMRPKAHHRVRVEFGGETVYKSDGNSKKNQHADYEDTISVRGTEDLNITTLYTRLFEITVDITITPDLVDNRPWQIESFTKIMEKYEAELQAYEDAMAEWEARQEEKLASRHPFAAEELMRSFVKKSAIWMMCDHFEDDDVMEMLTPDCGYPEINRPAAIAATERWNFFDNGFEWGLAEIKFYDFFRNPQCAWPETFDPDEPNFLFKAFLRAGYCRIQVPAAQGMGEDVAYYLQHGQPWGPSGQRPSGTNDDRYKSVVQELKHQYKCYQEDRIGCIHADPARTNASNEVVLDFKSNSDWIDPYWDPLGNTADTAEILLDENREIFIQGIIYRLVSITGMDASGNAWNVGDPKPVYYLLQLDRAFDSESYHVPGEPASGIVCHTHAVGAEYIGDPFYFELPTDLVWIGHQHSNCLPCYPVGCSDKPMFSQVGLNPSKPTEPDLPDGG